MAAPKLEQSQLSVYGFLDPRDFLRAVCDDLRNKGKIRSFESFSEWLGFGRNSYSHQIISGVRIISEKAAERLSNALGLDADEASYFTSLCRYHYAKDMNNRERAIADILQLRRKFAVSDLDAGQLEYFSEWYHAVVRELVSLDDFKPDAEWIAKKLRHALTAGEAAYSFRLLQRIGYVEFDPGTNRWIQTAKVITTPAEVRSIALQRYHHQLLEKARDAIFSVSAQERDVNAMTLPLSDDQYKAIKRILSETRQKVIAICVDSTSTNAAQAEKQPERIYQLTTQLFPVTTRGEK